MERNETRTYYLDSMQPFAFAALSCAATLMFLFNQTSQAGWRCYGVAWRGKVGARGWMTRRGAWRWQKRRRAASAMPAENCGNLIFRKMSFRESISRFKLHPSLLKSLPCRRRAAKLKREQSRRGKGSSNKYQIIHTLKEKNISHETG